jgi:hypothetical protein
MVFTPSKYGPHDSDFVATVDRRKRALPIGSWASDGVGFLYAQIVGAMTDKAERFKTSYHVRG